MTRCREKRRARRVQGTADSEPDVQDRKRNTGRTEQPSSNDAPSSDNLGPLCPWADGTPYDMLEPPNAVPPTSLVPAIGAPEDPRTSAPPGAAIDPGVEY
jgi:hypothetical protein